MFVLPTPPGQPFPHQTDDQRGDGDARKPALAESPPYDVPKPAASNSESAFHTPRPGIFSTLPNHLDRIKLDTTRHQSTSRQKSTTADTMADINAAQPGNAGQPGVSPPLPANVAAVVAFLQQMRHTYTEHDERVHVFPLSPADFQKLVAHIFPPNEQLEWGFHTPVPGYNERLFAFLARIQARFRYSGYSSLLEIALAGTVMHRRAREEVPKVFKDRFAAIAIANEDGLLNEDQIAAISDATVCVEFDVRVNVRNTPDSDNVGSVFLGKMTFDALLITPSSGMVFENNFVRDRTPGELEGKSPLRRLSVTSPRRPSADSPKTPADLS